MWSQHLERNCSGTPQPRARPVYAANSTGAEQGTRVYGPTWACECDAARTGPSSREQRSCGRSPEHAGRVADRSTAQPTRSRSSSGVPSAMWNTPPASPSFLNPESLSSALPRFARFNHELNQAECRRWYNRAERIANSIDRCFRCIEKLPVSSAVKPRKKRNSTMRHLRGSRASSSFRVRYRWIASTGLTSIQAKPCSKGTGTPPWRLLRTGCAVIHKNPSHKPGGEPRSVAIFKAKLRCRISSEGCLATSSAA